MLPCNCYHKNVVYIHFTSGGGGGGGGIEEWRSRGQEPGRIREGYKGGRVEGGKVYFPSKGGRNIEIKFYTMCNIL